MLTVQYKGKGERTIGTQVVYPGELLHPSPNLLAAWQAEHGDVFVVVAGAEPPTVEDSAGAIVVEDDAAHGFDSVAAADQAADAAPKAKRK